jgi:hypothetical protein
MKARDIVASSLTVTQSKTLVTKALSDLESLRRKASNVTLRGSNLEILNGAVSALLGAKNIIGGDGISDWKTKVKNALVRAESAINTIVTFGLLSRSDLGLSAFQSITYGIGELPETLFAVGTKVADTGKQAAESVGDALKSILKNLGLVVPVVAVLAVILVFITVKAKAKG